MFPILSMSTIGNLGRHLLAAAALAVSIATPMIATAETKVSLLRTPNNGLQPQAVTDEQGVVHLVYLGNSPKAADVLYARKLPGQDGFSAPIQINSRAGSAIAVGTIRGAQLAVGKGGRVHVVWNGSSSAGPRHEGMPLWYSRSSDDGKSFEKERDLITYTGALDGGGSVAADPQGNVYVVWHGHRPGAPKDESGRAVYVARSRDEGRTFTQEEPVTPETGGVCACCGLKAFADASGATYVLYRAADQKVNRNETLLVAPKPHAPFGIALSHPWKAETCPMSSGSVTATPGHAIAAWETGSQVYFATVDRKTLKSGTPIPAPGAGKRKHPVAIQNGRGETLFVWTEGTGWERGGAVAWQVFDSNTRPTDQKGRQDGVPVWGLATAFANSDGSFTIVY